METRSPLLTRSLLFLLLILLISTALQSSVHALALRHQISNLQRSDRSTELNTDREVFRSSEIYEIDYKGPRTHYTSSPSPYPRKGSRSSQHGVHAKTYSGKSGHG